MIGLQSQIERMVFVFTRIFITHKFRRGLKVESITRSDCIGSYMPFMPVKDLRNLYLSDNQQTKKQ